MTQDELEQIIDKTLKDCKTTMIDKRRIYQGYQPDPFHNFTVGAEIMGLFDEEGKPKDYQACWGYMVKHLSAIRSFIGDDSVSIYEIEEKIGDTINYLMLLKGMLFARHQRYKAKHEID